jgi:hypothetical protein
MDLKEAIIIETKVGSGIGEEHRQQLRNYLRSAAKNDNAIIKKIKTGLVLNFKKNEVFTESVRQRKETQDIEIEVWTLEKNKFTQHYSNKKSGRKILKCFCGHPLIRCRPSPHLYPYLLNARSKSSEPLVFV